MLFLCHERMPMNESSTIWELTEGVGPIMATAIHHGHEVRPDVACRLALDDQARLREEDPYTGDWACVGDTRLVVQRSRFEMDLNRPRDKAVYLTPADAWGLTVWHEPPSAELVAQSLAQYDAFYRLLHDVLMRLKQRYEKFVILDLHTYNHRRQGPTGPVGDPILNPEINVGTGSMDRDRWAPLVDRFIADLCGHDYMGRTLDVRENVKFKGGWMAHWIHQTFPDCACVLSVEVKKTFMDEWTGELYADLTAAHHCALAGTLPGLREYLLQEKEAA